MYLRFLCPTPYRHSWKKPLNNRQFRQYRHFQGIPVISLELLWIPGISRVFPANAAGKFGFYFFLILYLLWTNAPVWLTAFTVHYVVQGWSNSKASYQQAFRCSTLYWPIQIPIRALFHRSFKTVCHYSCKAVNAATSPEYRVIQARVCVEVLKNSVCTKSFLKKLKNNSYETVNSKV